MATMKDIIQSPLLALRKPIEKAEGCLLYTSSI